MKKVYTYLTVTLLFSFAVSTSFSQNNLAAGDIAIVSYQSDVDLTNTFNPAIAEFEDRFSIVVLKPGGLAAGTVIYFTDRGWDGPNNTWLDNATVGHEAVIKWVVPVAGVAQGTELYFINLYHDETAPPNVYTWDAYTTEAGTTKIGVVTSETNPATDGGGMGFTVSGDELLVYQTGPTAGPAGVYSATPIRFVTALLANIVTGTTTYAGWDATPISLNESSLPPGLVNGQTAFVMSPGPLPGTSNGTLEPDNGKYNCTGSSGVSCSALAQSSIIYTTKNRTYNNAAFTIGATSSNCSYALLSAVTYATQPSPVTACSGLPVSFNVSASGSGSLSYQWQESADTVFSAPATLSNTGVYSGTGTNTLAISNDSTLNGKYYRAVVTGSCGAVNSTGALLTVTSPSLSGNDSVTRSVGTQNNIYYAASCAAITKIVPSGAIGTQVTGNVKAWVWVEALVPHVGVQPFVQRHYQITPATNPTTATATVTLYFSQAEFNNFNADPNSTLDLPTGAADAVGKANLRIAKYNGSSNNGSGLPVSYTSTSSIIDPPDANIVYNATFSRWEVTFDVAGFSGFTVQTSTIVLPVKLISFAAQRTSTAIEANWQTSAEMNNHHFELERSTDGRNFNFVGQVAGNNGNRISNYSYTDVGATLLHVSKLFYRLKVISQSGDFEYSNIIVLSLNKSVQLLTSVVPNPFVDKLSLNLNMPAKGNLNIKITDVSGRVLITENAEVVKGFSAHFVQGVNKLAGGVYLLSVLFEGEMFTYKLFK